jgi:capsular exopolysaccharide synthesis family protein
LVESLDWREHVQRIEGEPNLSIITSGPIPPNPSELIGSEKIKSFIEELKGEYDYVIIDTPPIGVVTDAALVAAYVDGTILVIASGNVEIELAKHSKESLVNVGANILGVVLNRVKEKTRGYYKYYYSSYFTEEEAEGDYSGKHKSDKKKRKKA